MKKMLLAVLFVVAMAVPAMASCQGNCGSDMGICQGQCMGDGQCIARCAEQHGRCISRCR